MKTSLTSRNHTDWARRYTGTYGWLHKDNNKKLLVYVQNVNSQQVTFTRDDLEYYAMVDSGVNFEFIPVNRGWYNSKSGNVYFLCRHPMRQWKRGICSDNTVVTTSESPLYGAVRVGWGVLSDIFDGVEDPWANVDINKRAVALSKTFAISLNGTFYFYDQVVGKVTNNKIVLNNDLVHQEVIDMCRRNNYQFQVEVANG